MEEKEDGRSSESDCEYEREEKLEADAKERARKNLSSHFSPFLEKIPREYRNPKSLADVDCDPGWFARFLITSCEGRPNKVQLAARIARRVVEMLEYDLQSPTSNSFIDACASGETQHVKAYIKAGNDVDVQHSELGSCGLHLACEYNQIEIVKLLLQHGADYQIEKKFSRDTPLHCAAENGHLELTQHLVFQVGADRRRRNLKDLLPFDLAYEQRHLAVADVLRQEPEAVTDITYAFERLTCSTATLKWSHPSDNGTPITKYEICLNTVKGVETDIGKSQQRLASNIPGNLTSYTFDEELTPATTYSALIRAYNASGWSKQGKEYLFETLPDIPETPDCPYIAETGATCVSIDLEWCAPYSNNGEIVCFYDLEMAKILDNAEVEWKNIEYVAGKTISVETKQNGDYRKETQLHIIRYTIEDLESSSCYRFRIRAKNKVGWSSFSSPSNTISTRPPVKALDISSRIILVSWKEIIDSRMEGNVSLWEVQRTQAPYPGCNNYDWRTAEWITVSEDVVGEMTEYTLRELEADTMYYVRVRPYLTQEGTFLSWSKCAVSIGIVTSEATPEEPLAPTFDQITHNCVELGWKFPRDNGNCIDKFSLRMCKLSLGTWFTIAQNIHATEDELDKPGDTYYYQVENLDQASEYIFAVRAHNQIGWSTYSAVSEVVRTRSCAPPTAPRLACKTDSMLQVEWTISPNFIESIQTYEVHVKRHRQEDELESKDGDDYEWKVLEDRFFTNHRSTVSSARAENLLPVSLYSFRVRAQTPDGDWTNFSLEGGPFKTNRRF